MAFLGIRIEHSIGRFLSSIDVPGKKEDSSQYHITLHCFEENLPISDIAKALEVAYDIIAKCKPFLVNIETINCFPKREDNPVPIIAKVKSQELHELREKLSNSFKKNKVDFYDNFKFNPHITLSYADDEIEEIEIDPIEFSVAELVLWGGDNGDDRLFITFPLKNPEQHKNSNLLKKIDKFYKKSQLL